VDPAQGDLLPDNHDDAAVAGPPLHGAVFLGDMIVPLTAAASRSLPAVTSHAIDFAET
jgi:hypothetical protein